MWVAANWRQRTRDKLSRCLELRSCCGSQTRAPVLPQRGYVLQARVVLTRDGCTHDPGNDLRQHPYVSSELNPGIAFVGHQLEFNSLTKYFYTNRSLPKKKLSQAGMVEINRLYRIIAKCEKQLAQLQPPPPAEHIDSEPMGSEPARKYEPVPKGNYVKAAIGVSLVLILYFAYRKFR